MTREVRIFSYASIDEKSALSVDEVNSIKQSNLKIIHVISSLRPDLITYTSDEDKLEITQWLPLSQQLLASDFEFLNSHLLLNSFFVKQKLSIADVGIFDGMIEIINQADNTQSHLKHPNLCRWLELMSNLLSCSDKLKVQLTIQKSPTILPLYTNDDDKSSAATKPTNTDSTDKFKKEKVKVPAASTDLSSSNASTASIITKENTTIKTSSTTSTTPVTPAVVIEEDLDPSKLDIRVGIIRKCWNHPESEKLLCEEIDVGEETCRSIASGLRAHYTAEEVQGRSVIVLANLKERPMAGFKSQGMVLCACNPDHTVVRLVEPPVTAKPGDRVTFTGFSGEVATPSQMVKKKILEKLAPGLRTDEKGVAYWNNVLFTINTENCTSTLPHASIS